MKKLLLAPVALLVSADAAFAATCGGASPLACSTPVPEISALQGTAAIAALAAVMLLAWERRRRAS